MPHTDSVLVHNLVLIYDAVLVDDLLHGLLHHAVYNALYWHLDPSKEALVRQSLNEGST